MPSLTLSNFLYFIFFFVKCKFSRSFLVPLLILTRLRLIKLSFLFSNPSKNSLNSSFSFSFCSFNLSKSAWLLNVLIKSSTKGFSKFKPR
ncbi:unnamed protein product [Meloidogyne enterolobii]|uniref:Uncharacterized protein n=1 Tax=Meloidogyne enterolobii TaxID=390850 RepID=A0ACB1B1V8_MELEN